MYRNWLNGSTESTVSNHKLIPSQLPRAKVETFKAEVNHVNRKTDYKQEPRTSQPKRSLIHSRNQPKNPTEEAEGHSKFS